MLAPSSLDKPLLFFIALGDHKVLSGTTEAGGAHHCQWRGQPHS